LRLLYPAVPQMSILVRKPGLQAHTLDVSYEQEGYIGWLEDCRILFKLSMPFIRACLPVTQEELDALYTGC